MKINYQMHDETFERHLRQWQVNEEKLEYTRQEIDPLKKQLIELTAIENKSSDDWVKIRSLQNQINRMPIYSPPDEKDVTPSFRRRLASYLHLWMCNASDNHSDYCGWLYDLTDASPAHKYYLNIIDQLEEKGANIDELLRHLTVYFGVASEAKQAINQVLSTLRPNKES